jgi:fructuronate reductase
VIDVKDNASSEAAIDALGGSEISAVTITVTEKGCCLTPSTGALDFKNPAFRADLEGGFSLRTLLGLLALALERRRQNGAAPLILINCDNVPSNGAWLGAAMLEFAVLRAAPTRWIEDRITFPCTMVDRIVPATTPDDIGRPRAHSRATRLRSSASRSGNGSSRISSPVSGRLWT